MMTPVAAQAQQAGGCQTDVQCKGDRICVRGACQDPGGPSPASPDSPPMIIDDGSKSAYSDPGWTKGAAILSFVGAAAVLGLGGASAATSDEDIPAIPLGAAATLVGAIVFPIAASGGGSGSERGSIALRIIGWVTYGLTIANAAVLIGLGVADDTLDLSGPIIATTVLGGVSGVSFGIDALIANSKSRAVAAAPGSEAPVIAAQPAAPAFTMAVGQVRDADFEAVPTLGFQLAY